jgi:glycosyltransferase involved in cell wall biosynthesis
METVSLVSVIIPVFNGERYLAEAIESVLAQTYRPIEIIVIDDGSTDGSFAVVQRYMSEVRYAFQPNRGAPVAQNHGIDLAGGELLAFLDADDLWVTEKLSWQMAAFETQPDLEAVFGYVRQFYSPDVEPDKRLNARYAREITAGYCTDTILIRVEAFRRIGYFRPEQRIGSFMEWFGRAQEQELKTALLPDVLAKRRIHDANLGIQERPSARIAYPRILKAALDRRRMNK